MKPIEEIQPIIMLEMEIKSEKSECNDIGNQEIWKDIENFEGYYQISNKGRVRSLDREIMFITGRKVKYFGKIMKFVKDKEGYLAASFSKNNKKYSPKIHRLVAKAFIPNPNNLPEVNHKNMIKSNNSVENLEWITNLENMRHAYNLKYRKEGTKRKITKGIECSWSKLDNSKVLKIRELHSTGNYSYQQIANMFYISNGTVEHIVKRQTWKHI